MLKVRIRLTKKKKIIMKKNTHKLFLFRSSHPEVFYKKGVLRNFEKFTGRHLCQSLVLNKVAGLRAATLLKRNYGPGVSL